MRKQLGAADLFPSVCFPDYDALPSRQGPYYVVPSCPTLKSVLNPLCYFVLLPSNIPAIQALCSFPELHLLFPNFPLTSTLAENPLLLLLTPLWLAGSPNL